MTTRDQLFLKSEHEPKTFDKDHLLPNLPLPSLSDTLERYYESLKPFGNAEQLANSRRIIENFKNGIGQKLHSILVDRAKTHRNWVRCRVLYYYVSFFNLILTNFRSKNGGKIMRTVQTVLHVYRYEPWQPSL